MTTVPTQAVVKIRWARGCFTSPLLPVEEASQLAARLLRDVVDCGTGFGFVSFAGFGGREVRVRGRDVVAVECVPDLGDRTSPPPLSDRGVRPPGHDEDSAGGAAPDGTAWLRQQAAHSGGPR